jgi:hypothetical protein
MLVLALVMLAAAGASEAGSQPAARQAPRTWMGLTETVALASGNKVHRTTIAHAPRLFTGLRVTRSFGVEGAIELLRVLDNSSDISRPAGPPPSYRGIAGSIVYISPGRRTGWGETVSIGAGSYVESGQTEQVHGQTAGLEGETAAWRYGAITGGLRIVMIPRHKASRFTNFGAVIGLRTGGRPRAP